MLFIIGINFEAGDWDITYQQYRALRRELPAEAVLAVELGNEVRRRRRKPAVHSHSGGARAQSGSGWAPMERRRGAAAAFLCGLTRRLTPGAHLPPPPPQPTHLVPAAQLLPRQVGQEPA
jgi:hypothetical protein